MAIGDQLYNALASAGQTYLNLSERRAEEQRLLEAEKRRDQRGLEAEQRERAYKDEDYLKELRRKAARMPGVETATEGEIQAWLVQQGRQDKVEEATALAEAKPGVDLVGRAAAAKAYLPGGVTPRTATEEQVAFAEQQKYIADNISKGEQATFEYRRALEAETAEYNKLAAAAKVNPVVLPGQERIKTLVNAATDDFAAIKNAKTEEERDARVRGFLRTNSELLDPVERQSIDSLPVEKAVAKATEIVRLAGSDPESYAKLRLGNTYDKLRDQDVRVMTAFQRDPMSALDRAQLGGYQAAAAARAAAYQKLMSLELPIDYTRGSPERAMAFAYRVKDGEFKSPEEFEAARRKARTEFGKIIDPDTGLGPGATQQKVLDASGALNKGGSFADIGKTPPGALPDPASLAFAGAAAPPPPAPKPVDPVTTAKLGDSPEKIAALREESVAFQKREKLAKEREALAQQKEKELATAQANLELAFEEAKNPGKARLRRGRETAFGFTGMGAPGFGPSAPVTDDEVMANYEMQLARVEKLRREAAALRSGEDLPSDLPPPAPTASAPFQGMGEFYGLSPEERQRKAAEMRARVAAERAAASQSRLDSGYAGLRQR